MNKIYLLLLALLFSMPVISRIQVGIGVQYNHHIPIYGYDDSNVSKRDVLQSSTAYMVYGRTNLGGGSFSSWTSTTCTTLTNDGTDAEVYQPLNIDGFNHDVIANGVGAATTSTTTDVDGVSYCFKSIDWQLTATSTPQTSGFPLNGIINSFATTGLSYQLQSYSSNNVIRLASTAPSITSVVTGAVKAKKLFVLVTSGSGTSNLECVVTFQDNSTESFLTNPVTDWFNGTNPPVAYSGFGRLNRDNNGVENSTTNPRLYQITLNIAIANQAKEIKSIKFTRGTTSVGVINIFAVSAENLGTCPSPDAVLINAITTTTATATLTAPALIPSVGYDYEVRSTGAGGSGAEGLVTSGTIASNSTVANLTGLPASQTLHFYIRSNCSATDQGVWTGPYSFTMLCDDFEEFYENFDNQPVGSPTNPSLPTCWGAIDDGDGYFYTSNASSYSASRSFYLYNNSQISGNLMLVSPKTDNLGNGAYRIRFRARSTTTSSQTLNVVTLASQTSASDMHLLQTIDITNEFKEYIVDLPAGTHDYFGIAHGFGTTYRAIYVDDIRFEPIPPCVVPSGLIVSNVGLNTADVSWTATPSTNTGGYTYEIRTSGEPGSGTDGLAFTGTTDAATTSVNLSDLTRGTPYWVYVMANCGAEDNSYWTDGVPFTPNWCLPAYSTGSSNHRINTVNIDEISFTDEIPSYTSRDRTGIIVPDLTAGDTYTFNVTTTGYTGMGVAIDFNKDGNFDETDEVLALPDYIANSTQTYTVSVTIPQDVYSGIYRMRIWNRGGNAGGIGESDPCGSYDYGTWADYTVNLTGGRTPCVIPDLISTTPDAICGPGQAQLEATYTAGTVKWYAAATGGSVLATGSTFTTPTINATTSYWVSSDASGEFSTVGRTAPDTESTYMDEDTGLIFNALESVELQSVSVYAVTAGTINIKIVNSAGTEIYSTGNVNVLAGGSTTPNIIPLDFTVPTGTNYRMLIKNYSGANLIRESNIGGFPYTDENLVITHGYFLGISASYYYFYDIKHVKYESGCASPRTEVVATVTTPPVLTLSETEIVICQDSFSDAVTVTAGASDYDIYTWSPAIGVSGDAQDGWVFSPTISTTYTLTATQTEGEQCWAEFELQVDVHRLEVSGSQVDVTCYGGEDGSAEVTISEGQAPYSYVWTHDADLDGGQATGLSVGTYIVTVTDANGCTATVDFDITEPVAVPSPEVESTVAYVYGDPTVPLTATAALDHTLRWYTVASGGTGSLTAPIPTSSEVGVQRFWVSQITAEGCESERTMTEVSVAAATLTIVADAQTKGYGAADPLWTYTVSGLQRGEEATDVLMGILTRDIGEAVGDYAITQGTLAASSNYTLHYVSADLTITPAVLTVTADAQTKVYGAADPLWTYTVSGLQHGEAATDILTGSLVRDIGESVGDYVITQGTLAASADYTLHYASADLTITPAVLTVTADAQTKVYGAADPLWTYTVSGLQHGEAATDILTGSLARDIGESVGDYALTQGTLSASSNYTLHYASADLTITPAVLTVTADVQTKVYGAADPVWTYTVSGLQYNDEEDDILTGSLARDIGESVGDYAITQGTLATSANYTLDYIEADLTITPAVLTVTAYAQTKVYGAADPLWTYTVSGLQYNDEAGDVLTGILTRDIGESVGDYAITQGTLAASSNYTLHYVPADLTITPAVLTVTADVQTKVYGAADPLWTYTVSGLQHGEAATDILTGSLARDIGESVGDYAITQGTLSASSNYTLHYASAYLTITPAVLTVTADVQTKVYGAADPLWTYTISGLQYNDEEDDILMGSLARDIGESVGDYAITQGTLAASSNYTLHYVPADLTITPAVLTVTADVQTKVYGAADPVWTYTVSGLQYNDEEDDILTGSLARDIGEAVGHYAITQGTLSASANYTLHYASAYLTITPAVLTVTADAQTKVYGAADPLWTYTVSGLQHGNEAGDVLTGSLARNAGESVGDYVITQGTLAASANYTLHYVPADLTITPAILTVTADAQTKVYGAADPLWTYTVSGLQYNDEEDDVLTGILTRDIGEAVGDYAITQGTLAASANYTLDYIEADLTITSAVLTVTADAQTKVYGAADPLWTYTVSGLQYNDEAGDVLTGILTRDIGESVGDYAITQGTLAASSNYTLHYVSADLTITPAVLTVTADVQTKVYGAADPVWTYTVSGLQYNDEEDDVLTGSLARNAGESVGDYVITQGTLAALANYTLHYASAYLTITPAVLTVTADAQTKVYGAADPLWTYTVSGLQHGEAATDILTGSLARDIGESVGDYALTQGTLSASSNYTLHYASADLTITPAVLTVTADVQTKVYGAADPVWTYTVSGLQYNDEEDDILTGSLARDIGESVGDYAITQGTLATSANYTLDYIEADLTITPAVLTVTAYAQTKVYGAADPLWTYTVSGLQYNDEAGDVLTGILTRDIGESVGDYAITQGTLAASSNYTLHYVPADLTITPAVLTVTADVQTKVYGAADPLWTYTVSGLQHGEAATDILTGSLARDIGESVGDYAITQGTLSASSNYTLHYASAYLTITPAVLTVTADVQTKVYGAADPLWTYTISGLQYNDEEDDILMGSLARDIGESVGDYAITQGTLAASSNYTLHYVPADLTITPAVLTVTADVQTKVYGAADPVWTYTVSGLQYNDEEDDILTGSLARDIGEAVGHYAITQGTLSASANYTLHYASAYLTITPAVLTVTADAQTKVYGAADPLWTYTVSGLQHGNEAGDVLTGSLARNAGESVGDYVITQGTLAASANYTLHYVPADLTITPAILTVTADAQTKVYGAADPLWTYTVSGLQYNDEEDDVLTGILTRDIGEAVGDYAITQGTLAASANYTLDYIEADLTITSAVLTVTADAQTKVYGAADPLWTYTVSGLQYNDEAGDVLTGILTRDIGESVGDYAITQGTLAASSNYTLHYVSADLTITPAVLTVTADAQTKVYGDADPVLIYTVSGLQLGEDATDVLTGRLSRAIGEDVGSYEITLGDLIANGNYTIFFVNGELMITARRLTVRANPISKLLGLSDPGLTYVVDGLLSGDYADDILSGTLRREAGERVGHYGIYQGSLRTSGNYMIDGFVENVLHIMAGLELATIEPLLLTEREVREIPFTVTNTWSESYTTGDVIIWQVFVGQGLEVTDITGEGLQAVNMGDYWQLYLLESWHSGANRSVVMTVTAVNRYQGSTNVQINLYNPRNTTDIPDEGLLIDVMVEEGEYQIGIPNVFTPNGDGINDVFKIDGLHDFDRVELFVYNSMGIEVYRNANYKNTWDAYGLKDGTYLYMVRTYKGRGGKDHRGYVLVKRW